jgi:hypothetical protein
MEHCCLLTIEVISKKPKKFPFHKKMIYPTKVGQMDEEAVEGCRCFT